jgi:hypothetical protein
MVVTPARCRRRFDGAYVMRFIHAADLYLDSPLTGLHERAGSRAEDLAGVKSLPSVALPETNASH